MTYAVGKFTTKTTKDVHDDILRVVCNGMIQKGISANPQLGPGSDEDLWATAISNEAAPLYANTVIKADAQMADSAAGVAPVGQNVGADLQRVMAIYGLAPRAAVPSSGNITLVCSATTTIPAGTQLVDSQGLRYEVETPGVYANGALVPILAVDTGTVTNHAAGDVLTWVAAPTYCNSKQSVATGGLTGGADAETNDAARARLLDRLQNPPGSGNSTAAIQYAEESSPLVQKAFCYPAVNGPSTCHVAVTAATSTRFVDSVTLANIVTPYVLGKMPEYVEVVVTTTTAENVDVAVGLTLPASPQASPAGPGGGWIDGSPWPAISGTANTYANVTAVTPGSTTQFTVNAPTPPTDNVSHICFWDMGAIDTDGSVGVLRRAKVLSHTGTAGAYVITIDQPFTNVSASGGTGSLIFPDAVNMATYAKAYAKAMIAMGPGEKTSNVSVLTRGYRHPTPQQSWPSSLNAQQLKAVEDTGPEVLDTSWYYRSATTPNVPASVADAPYILILRNLGFYPI